MKKVIFLFMASLFSLFAMAQSTLYIYKTDGSAISYTIATVDSISFNAAQDSLYINQSSGSLVADKTATIDSISFTHPGVLINGVYWASRNVAAPGTFATNPEDAGMFYQWNRKVGWVTGTGWSSSWNGGYTTPSATDKWTATNDPCPAGYRVPTDAEIQTLLNTTKVTSTWITQGGVYGRKFTEIATSNSIFLPASGYRSDFDATLYNAGSKGYYWNSTAGNDLCAYGLYFGSSDTSWGDSGRAYGFTVRPVAK